MTTLTTIPDLPAPGRKVAIVFTKTNATANYIRAWLTDAPVGTPERKEIEGSGKGRIQLWEGDSGGRKEFVPAKGGIYRLVAQEYAQAATHGGTHERDPNAAPSSVLVGSEYSISLTIGQRMTMDCGVGADIATLVLYVFGSTIRATTLADQGETTPIVKDGSTGRAKIAEASAAVKSAALALADVAVSTATGSAATVITNIVDMFRLHLSEGGVHSNSDTDNVMDTGFSSTIAPGDMSSVVSKLLTSVRQHYLNDNGQGPGTAGTDPAAGDVTPNPYHSAFDYTNMPLFSSVSGVSESYRALADIWRSYEAHRADDNIHLNDDTTNDLAALPVLLTVHKEFFAQLAALSPTVPDTQTSGAVQLMTQVGAIETDPT